MGNENRSGPAGAHASSAATVYVGTADVRLPATLRDRFPAGDSLLARYAGVFNAVEVNRTFKATPRPATFERWATTVPEGFRFSLKLPRRITHVLRLVDAQEELRDFVDAATHLGDRRGPFLVQLPPSLAFDAGLCERFLRALRALVPGPDALEARHPTWFTPEAEELLRRLRVARVAADPPRAPGDGTPAGDEEIAYFRLHGVPQIYYSAYDGDALARWAERIARARGVAGEVWCIFDNTALDAATENALELQERLGAGNGRRGKTAPGS